eukprot:CAMPEP_0114513508 /NCGR_PEP_ID=MMETSP0109-20121206/15616_1 /TAXON_ID=29199 /ORGANISM="Chlorarachnion reptans, Strain CCCM449" /LENGTH=37 /DNA_ID= /DNA_START= /DNA_END= /DNA_ORIENTATION=
MPPSITLPLLLLLHLRTSFGLPWAPTAAPSTSAALDS